MNFADRFLEICAADIGKKEVGINRGDWVDEINRWIGAQLGSAYCVSWIQHRLYLCAKELGLEINLPKSPSCLQFAKLQRKENIIYSRSNVQPGDIIIWIKKGSWKGHAGVCSKVLGDGKIETIEANTSPPTGDQREGDGVYLKVRNINGFGSLELRAIVRPKL